MKLAIPIKITNIKQEISVVYHCVKVFICIVFVCLFGKKVRGYHKLFDRGKTGCT